MGGATAYGGGGMGSMMGGAGRMMGFPAQPAYGTQPPIPGQGAPGAPLPPGAEAPTPGELPPENPDNSGMIIAAILGGSALIGLIVGCAMFRKKGDVDGDSDEDADSDDESEDSE